MSERTQVTRWDYVIHSRSKKVVDALERGTFDAPNSDAATAECERRASKHGKSAYYAFSPHRPNRHDPASRLRDTQGGEQ
ncbi:hypothetical protein ACHMW5_13865 [Azospirillum melinis]|uniref:hypothetical protein n=1 Tax=Azospirillum melinis TaxID=328839 RepID=UPI003756587B